MYDSDSVYGSSAQGPPPYVSPACSPHLRHIGVSGLAANGLPDKLAYVDFWPTFLHSDDGFRNAVFERFDTLPPKANTWLRDRPRYTVLKCETIEKKVSSADQLTDTNPKFDVPEANIVVYTVLGLRLWYTSEIPLDKKLPSHSSQIGYRNFLPRCIDVTPRSMAFDDLTDTYEELNETIIERPLEGKIVTVESVRLRLQRPDWEGPDVVPDQTHWLDTQKFHFFCMTRVFYLFECPAYEQIGAADFLPDYLPYDPQGRSPASPKYSDFYSVIVKVNQWLEKVKEVRIVNIQSMETVFPGLSNAGSVNTGANFTPKADAGPLVRFVRITYVRPKFGLPPGGLYVPRVITYKTFIPSVVGSSPGGAPEFESVAVLWNRVRNWLQQSDRRIVGMEVVHHPMPLLLRKKDEAESTIIKGLWVFSPNSALEQLERLPMIELIRVYFDGRMVSNVSPPASVGSAASYGRHSAQSIAFFALVLPVENNTYEPGNAHHHSTPRPQHKSEEAHQIIGFIQETTAPHTKQTSDCSAIRMENAVCSTRDKISIFMSCQLMEIYVSEAGVGR
ncbi:hypothetical protein CAPTEDRAFT_223060 [Capitella teleta]|uniref:Uncharacterized protein n=1 Tax=Capitella teleta TaxID=283909 RepID=R7ULL1_CAPTE|nr:hypothetical protein CAPTEDRAFT_223060 [Capitella teleta]|eukprot:ELU04827.1 hypothetical protein CAPTEDRAFT_223060 [Capitella teleta]